MNNRKKKVTAAVAVSSLAAAMVAGGIMAYFTDGDTVTNTFTVGKVSMVLEEPNFDESKAVDLVPNQEVKKDPTLTNTGINDAYMFAETEVPFASIIRANQDGTVNDEFPTELLAYTVNPGWTEITYRNGRLLDNIEGKSTTAKAYSANNYTVKDAAGQNTPITASNNGESEVTKSPVVSADGVNMPMGYYDYYDYYTIGSDKYDTLQAAQAAADYVAGDQTITAHERYIVNGEVFDTLAAAQTKSQAMEAQYGTGCTESIILHVGFVKHLYAWTGANAVQTETDDTIMERVTPTGEKSKTAPLFNAVRVVNGVEDLGLERSTHDLIVNAYAIQADFLNNADGTIDGTASAGKEKAGEVWDVLNAQSNSTVEADYIFGRDDTAPEDTSTDIRTPQP